ncbi:MAG TPA: hypothetical protein VHG08_21405 [Longimicrobium sp.]|nr:hypothetical protein [Longimicrobium sp.]
MDRDRADDARLGELLRAHDPPPPVPAGEMWDAIALDLRRRTSPRARWARRAALLAASLVLGVIVGEQTAGIAPRRDAAAPIPRPASASIPRAYRLALDGHLAEAQPVLAQIERGGPAGTVDESARRLLVTTRVLLASPAADDAAAAALLRDLELVLSQTVADGGTVLAADAIHARGVLPRLRAMAGGRA